MSIFTGYDLSIDYCEENEVVSVAKKNHIIII